MTINLEVLVVLSLLISTLLITYNLFLVKPISFTGEEYMEDTKNDEGTSKAAMLQSVANLAKKANERSEAPAEKKTSVWGNINRLRNEVM